MVEFGVELCPTSPLDQLVNTLVYTRDLEVGLDNSPDIRPQVLLNARVATQSAFEQRDPSSLAAVHRSLRQLYELHLFSDPVASENQYSPLLLGVRQVVEKGWRDSEIKRSGLVGNQIIPREPAEFAAFFQELVFSHPASNNRLYDFLQRCSSEDSVVGFLKSEYPLNVRFFDIVVLSALGSDGGIRREIAGNLWDESGQGERQRSFKRLIS